MPGPAALQAGSRVAALARTGAGSRAVVRRRAQHAECEPGHFGPWRLGATVLVRRQRDTAVRLDGGMAGPAVVLNWPTVRACGADRQPGSWLNAVSSRADSHRLAYDELRLLCLRRHTRMTAQLLRTVLQDRLGFLLRLGRDEQRHGLDQRQVREGLGKVAVGFS